MTDDDFYTQLFVWFSKEFILEELNKIIKVDPDFIRKLIKCVNKNIEEMAKNRKKRGKNDLSSL